MDQEVRRAAEGGVHEHRVLERLGGEHFTERATIVPLLVHGVGGAPSHVQPDGCPDGASAAWGTVSPNASATTCAVAAVPRNWQPPPG